MTPDPFGDAYNQSKTLPEDCCGRGRRDDHRWQLQSLNAQARREVSIGGRRIKVIDILKSQLLTVDLVLNASFLSDADKTAILSGNLAKLLKIS
jgi:hypothetical protein